METSTKGLKLGLFAATRENQILYLTYCFVLLFELLGIIHLICYKSPQRVFVVLFCK